MWWGHKGDVETSRTSRSDVRALTSEAWRWTVMWTGVRCSLFRVQLNSIFNERTDDIVCH